MYRVFNRVAVELNAYHLTRAALGGDYADGADAAVGVKHGFVSFKVGELDRLAVEHLGLHGVYLIKALGRNAESAAAQDVLDIALAVQHDLSVAEHEIRLMRVHILHDGSDLGELFAYRLDKIIL